MFIFRNPLMFPSWEGAAEIGGALQVRDQSQLRKSTMTSHPPHAPAAPHPVTTLFEPPLPEGHARDPVCGMVATPSSAQALRLWRVGHRLSERNAGRIPLLLPIGFPIEFSGKQVELLVVISHWS
jgi:hypothetical protein